MKIEGKENVWFPSQINLNLHYKGKGYSGQQSVNWKHKAFPYYKRESVTTFLHEQGHDKMNNFIYYLLERRPCYFIRSHCLKNGKYKVKMFQSLHESCTTLIVSAEHGIASHILNLKLLNHALNYNQSWKWLLNKFVQCYKNSPKPKRQ